MLFWHVGGAVLLFRYVFRDPKVDVRLLAVGAVLPNMIDKPLGLLGGEAVGATRLVGHSLLFSTAVMAVALIATRRGRRRRGWMAVAIGSMLHLLLDGMWTSAATFLWPLFGWGFTADAGGDGLVALLGAELESPVTWLQEIGGAAYLAHLYRKAGLGEPERRRAFAATGRLAA